MKKEGSKYINLCVKSLTGEISPVEEKMLKNWLAVSSNMKIYDMIKNLWNLTEPPALPNMPDKEEEWIKIEHAIVSEPEVKYKREKRVFQLLDKGIFSNIFANRYRTAGLAFATAIVMIFSIFLIRNIAINLSFEKFVTKNGQRSKILLSDGSTVQLNYSSSIRFKKHFNKDIRKIELRGEAFFTVKHDSRPFIVETENALTEVLGTEFNIWNRNNETRVIVKSGLVKLASENSTISNIILKRGQMSSITGDSGPQKPKNVNTNRLLGWLEGKFAFDHSPLREIAEELERAYDVSIKMKNPELETLTVTAVFDSTSIDVILSSLCLTLGVQYKERGGNFVIFK